MASSTKTFQEIEIQAEQALKSWAAFRFANTGSGDPLAELKYASGRGSHRSSDQMALLYCASFVESTFNFHGAKPVLAWAYALGRDMEEYPFRRPGEPYAEALMRHGVGSSLKDAGFPPSMAAFYVHDCFRKELCYRIEAEGVPTMPEFQEMESKFDGPVTPGELAQAALLRQIRADIMAMRWAEAHGKFTRLEEMRRQVYLLTA